MADTLDRHPEEHPEAHEQSDVSVRALGISLVLLFIVLVVTCVLVYGMFRVYENRAVSHDKAEVRSGVKTQRADPPVPLQGIPGFHGNTPAEDLKQMRAKQRGELSNYSRTSEAGYVKIPIDRAMELVVEKDLLKQPATQAATQPRDGGTHAQ